MKNTDTILSVCVLPHTFSLVVSLLCEREKLDNGKCRQPQKVTENGNGTVKKENRMLYVVEG